MCTVPGMDCGKPVSELVVVVDMQNDFVTGSLGTKEARAIVPPMVSFLKKCESPVLFTLDTHGSDYLKTFEGRRLPVPHCLSGTRGHEIVADLLPLATRRVEKDTFGSLLLARKIAEMESLKKVTMMGVCTDICVVANALLIRTFRPSLTIEVIGDLCAGTTRERHLEALDVMRSCQIDIV